MTCAKAGSGGMVALGGRAWGGRAAGLAGNAVGLGNVQIQSGIWKPGRGRREGCGVAGGGGREGCKQPLRRRESLVGLLLDQRWIPSDTFVFLQLCLLCAGRSPRSKGTYLLRASLALSLDPHPATWEFSALGPGPAS